MSPWTKGQHLPQTRLGIVSFCPFGQHKIWECFILSWFLEGREIIMLEHPLDAGCCAK